MNILQGVRGRRIKAHFPSHATTPDDPEDKYDKHIDKHMLTCTYTQFVQLWLPRWYSAEDIERMLTGLNYVNVQHIRHQDLPR